MNFKTEDNDMNMYTSGNLNENNNTHNEFGMYDELQNNDIMNQFEDTPYVSQVKEPKKKSAKDIFAIIFGIIMVVGLAGWCLISGINAMFLAPVHPMEEAFSGLMEGDVYEGTISCISPEIGELKHTINFIPAGTEHFYLMVSEDGSKVIPIRASSKWHNQFTDTNLMEVNLQERAIVREMDYKVRNELISDIASSLSVEGIQVEQSLYLDLNANKLGMLQIFTGLSIILCTLYFVFITCREENDVEALKTPVSIGMFVLVMVTLAMIIYLLNMVGF